MDPTAHLLALASLAAIAGTARGVLGVRECGWLVWNSGPAGIPSCRIADLAAVAAGAAGGVRGGPLVGLAEWAKLLGPLVAA